jgi:hypothetical protein
MAAWEPLSGRSCPGQQIVILSYWADAWPLFVIILVSAAVGFSASAIISCAGDELFARQPENNSS